MVFVFRNRRPRSCLFVHFVFVFLFSIPPATGYKTSFGGSFGLTFDDSGGRLVSLLMSWDVIGTRFRRPWAQRVSKAIWVHSFFFESHFGDPSVPFFERGILFVFLFVTFWRTQKVSQNDSQKRLLGEPQEGSRLGGTSIFTFAAEPKKGSKMRAKMERFGSQGRHYTPFRSRMSRK